jgi:hypothetical protein
MTGQPPAPPPHAQPEPVPRHTPALVGQLLGVAAQARVDAAVAGQHVFAQLVHVAAAGSRQDDVVVEIRHLHLLEVEQLLPAGVGTGQGEVRSPREQRQPASQQPVQTWATCSSAARRQPPPAPAWIAEQPAPGQQQQQRQQQQQQAATHLQALLLMSSILEERQRSTRPPQMSPAAAAARSQQQQQQPGLCPGGMGPPAPCTALLAGPSRAGPGPGRSPARQQRTSRAPGQERPARPGKGLSEAVEARPARPPPPLSATSQLSRMSWHSSRTSSVQEVCSR